MFPCDVLEQSKNKFYCKQYHICKQGPSVMDKITPQLYYVIIHSKQTRP